MNTYAQKLVDAYQENNTKRNAMLLNPPMQDSAESGTDTAIWLEDTGTGQVNLFTESNETCLSRDKVETLKDTLEKWLKDNPAQ